MKGEKFEYFEQHFFGYGCPHFMAFQTGKGGYSEKLSSLGKKSALWDRLFAVRGHVTSFL